MKNKKAQQAVEASFSTIFSIFLIIAFIAFAFVAIKFFLGFKTSSQIGQFYTDLQKQVDTAKTSTTSSAEFEINLPEKLDYVCFLNTTEMQNNPDIEIDSFDRDSNVYLLPEKETKNLGSNMITSLNIAEMTKEQNPYCVSTTEVLIITKEAFSKLVVIK